MKVLVLTLIYAPDSCAQTITPLVERIVEAGHEVTVVAAMPHYGATAIYDGYRGSLWRQERRPGLRIVRLWLHVPRRPDSRIGKALSWLSFTVIATPAAWLVGRPDVILTLSPPYTLGLTAWTIGRLRRAPYVFNVQDVYPDVAIAMGVVRNRQLIRLMSWIERVIYRHAAAVTVIGEGARRNLREKGVPDAKLVVIPNIADSRVLRPGPRRNAFTERFGLADHFVAMYAGNVGDTLGIETIVETACQLRGDTHVLIVIVGRGTALPALEKRCAEEQLTNVRFLPYQGPDTVAEMYASSDVQLVIQRRGFSSLSIPMKVYGIMSAGRAIVASVDEEGDTAAVLREAGCGENASPEDPSGVAALIRRLSRDPERVARLGQNGRRYVETHLTPERSAEAYVACFESAVRK
jgi:colanic acid biosynthesis glycosyl transferase WcaI